MLLSTMMSQGRDELICDMAEAYRIYDIRKYKPFYIAILAVGLRDDSRIKMKLSGSKLTAEQTLLAGIFDRLSILCWQNTKDAQHGYNRPKSILEAFNEKKEDVMAFNSGSDFMEARKKLLRRKDGN